MVDGSEICPSKFSIDAEGKPTSTINPDFLVWQKKDQFVLAWLNATLSEKVLSMVYGLTTAQQVWAHLAKRFTPTSRTHISNLKRQLQTISQGSKSCTDYLLTAKSLADQLAAIGKGVEDEDLISFVIGGLNPSYHTFVTTFCYGNRDTSITFEDFQTELLNYEQLFEAHHKPQNTDGGQFAFHLHKPKSQHFPKKYRAPQYGRHSPRQQYSSAAPIRIATRASSTIQVSCLFSLWQASKLCCTIFFQHSPPARYVENLAIKYSIATTAWILPSKGDIHLLNL
jgi:hypothetical protein